MILTVTFSERRIENLGLFFQHADGQKEGSNTFLFLSETIYLLDNPYSFSLAADDQRDFYLYNPTDQAQAPGYTQVSVQITSGSTGTIYFCTAQVSDCVATPEATQTISMAGPTTWTSSPLTTTQQYQLMVVNGAGGTSSYSVTGSPNGLPAGTTTIQDSGKNQGVTRKLEITVPQQREQKPRPISRGFILFAFLPFLAWKRFYFCFILI